MGCPIDPVDPDGHPRANIYRREWTIHFADFWCHWAGRQLNDVAASFQLPISPVTQKNNRRTVKENNVYVGKRWFWREEKHM